MADRVEALRQAAQERHSATLHRAEDALQALVASGTPVTFARLAKAAKVSRSWLYCQDGLRAEVATPPPDRALSCPRRPRDQSATVESLRQQLHAYREEIARLRAENRALNDQLARSSALNESTTSPGREHRRRHVHDVKTPLYLGF
jgi:predicted RNase H-like nuclease (RuvC/YqgF family)